MDTSKTYIDLHSHSNFSADAEFEPEALVQEFAQAGIKIMALSDHNCVRGVKRACAEAKKQGIVCIPAGEFDCTCKGTNLHIVGYGIDVDSPDFERIEQNIRSQELVNSQLRLKLTNEMGFDIKKSQIDALAPDGIYAGEMFAEILLADSRYDECEMLKPYREGGSRSDNPLVSFYWDYYSQGKPCHTETKLPEVGELIKIINKNGGTAVLAHPHANLKQNTALLDTIKDAGIKGVEAYSSYHDEATARYYAERAAQLGLFVTCGSDFHGRTKPSIYPGKHGAQRCQAEIEAGLKAAGLI